MYFICMMFVMATAFYLWDVVAMVRLGVPAGTIVLKVCCMSCIVLTAITCLSWQAFEIWDLRPAYLACSF
jgi:hypothetical protein